MTGIRAFFDAYRKDPDCVSSIIPSSRWLNRRVAGKIPAGATVIVEYGPGTGVVSLELLKTLPREGTLIVIEKMQELADYLSANIKDKRVIVECDGAENAPALVAKYGFEHVDAVVSGIPFSRIPATACAEIMENAREILGPGAPFVAYQVKPAVRRYMAPCFSNITQERVWWNIPPLLIFTGRNPASKA